MYYLDTLTLQNVRSYRDRETTIKFSPGLTVITGHNGSGKSTMLEALTYLITKDKVNYSNLKSKTAKENDVMIMRCNLTKKNHSNDTIYRIKQQEMQLKSNTPNIKKADESSKGPNNDLKFEITYEFHRTGKSSKKQHVPENSEEAEKLQSFIGLFKYCLACSIDKSRWMLGPPDEFNKATNKILNINRFATLAKNFCPSNTQLASSKSSYNSSKENFLQQQTHLVKLINEFQTKNSAYSHVQCEYDTLLKYRDNFKVLTSIHDKILEQLKPYVISAEVYTVKGKQSTPEKTYKAFLDPSLTVLLFNRDDNSDYGSNCVLEYLDKCARNSPLSDLYKSICQLYSKQKESLDDSYPLLCIQRVLCQELKTLKAKNEILKIDLTTAQSKYKPDAIPIFLGNYESILTSLFALRNNLDEVSTFKLTSNDNSLPIKQSFVISFYTTLNKLPNSLSSTFFSSSCSDYPNVFFELSSLFAQITSTDLLLNNMIMSLDKQLKETEASIATLNQELTFNNDTLAAVSHLSVIADKIMSKNQDLQVLMTNELCKVRLHDELLTFCNTLQNDLDHAKSAYSSITSLRNNHCISCQTLNELKATFLGSKVFLNVPTILGIMQNNRSSPPNNIWSSCKSFLTDFENKWDNLVSSLEHLDYPLLSQLLDDNIEFSSRQLEKLRHILEFLIEKAYSCTDLGSSWHANLNMHAAIFFASLSKNVSGALQQWMFATGNLVKLVPTLRSDFSLYLNGLTTSSVPTEELMKIFEGFLMTYEHEAAEKKENMVHYISTALNAISHIFPAVITLYEMDMSVSELLTGLLTLETSSEMLDKVTFDKCEVTISTNGVKPKTILNDIIKDSIDILSTYDLNILDTELEIAYSTVDQDKFLSDLEVLFTNLLTAAGKLEDAEKEYELKIARLENERTQQEPALLSIKKELKEFEHKKSCLQSEISKLMEQFTSTSTENVQYSLEYAQKLNSKQMTLTERIKNLEKDINLAKLRSESLEKQLHDLSADNARLSLPDSVPLTKDKLTNIGKSLESIQNSPSESRIEDLKQSCDMMQTDIVKMNELNELLTRYIILEQEIARIMPCLNDINLPCTSLNIDSSCSRLQSAILQLRNILHKRGCTLKDLTTGLKDTLEEYSKTYDEITKELHQREGENKIYNSQIESLRQGFLKVTKSYAEAKTTLLVNTASAKLSDLMQQKVREFKHSILRKINTKLQSLWQQCYARVDHNGIEIREVCLAVKLLDKGENSKEILELQAICTDPYSNEQIVRSFRDSCSSGQQVLASILLRLAFAYVSACPFSFIVLDEPTNYLDKQNTENLAHALAEFIQSESGTQMIIITHNTEFRDILIASTNNINVLAYKLSLEENGSVISEIDIDEDI